MKVYADRLKQLINEHGLKQQELADILNVFQNAIHNYVNNKREPSMEMQKKIADYFGVSIDYMMRTDEELSANSHNSKWKSNLMNKFSKVVYNGLNIMDKGEIQNAFQDGRRKGFRCGNIPIARDGERH